MSHVNGVSRRRFLRGLIASAVIPPGVALGLSPTNAAANFAVHSRGARVPVGLVNHIRAQNHNAAAVNATLHTDRDFVTALNAADSVLLAPPTSPPPQFDWRDRNRVTPVKDQDVCGSCWVFAAIAAFESAYLIANNQVGAQNGVPTINVSEQEALDCVFVENDCILGGWHEVVLLYLQLEGLVSGDTYRYRAAKSFARPT